MAAKKKQADKMRQVAVRMTSAQQRIIKRAAKDAKRGFSEHVRHVCGVVFKQCGHVTIEDCDCREVQA